MKPTICKNILSSETVGSQYTGSMSPGYGHVFAEIYIYIVIVLIASVVSLLTLPLIKKYGTSKIALAASLLLLVSWILVSFYLDRACGGAIGVFRFKFYTLSLFPAALWTIAWLTNSSKTYVAGSIFSLLIGLFYLVISSQSLP